MEYESVWVDWKSAGRQENEGSYIQDGERMQGEILKPDGF